jgi:hypothetical protein
MTSPLAVASATTTLRMATTGSRRGVQRGSDPRRSRSLHVAFVGPAGGGIESCPGDEPPPAIRAADARERIQPLCDSFTAMKGAVRLQSSESYVSSRLKPASECAKTLRFGPAYARPRDLARLCSRAPSLIVFLARLPEIPVPLSDGPAAAFIAEHLSLTRGGIPRFRVAQGVLHLPPDFSTYMRGRRRQAVRTNIRRARERGFDCDHFTVPDWVPSDRDSRFNVDAEHWLARGPGGETLAEGWLVVDDECALLYAMTSSGSYARWLLHTAMVERLCDSGCGLLITNSFDVPLMPAGQQHFQHLLGYSVARLLPPRSLHEPQRIARRRRTWQSRLTSST